ncbi:MAG: hypothetical protein MI919_36310, partial [Holophagales bacterium]|nr:hypothetical protein [Holophagales bacterium]
LLRVDLDLLARVLEARAELTADPALAALCRRAARAFRGEAVDPAPPVPWADPAASRDVAGLFQSLDTLRAGFSYAERRVLDTEGLGGGAGKAYTDLRRHPSRSKLGLGRMAEVAAFLGSDLPELLFVTASPAELPPPPPRGLLWAHRERKQPRPPDAAFEIQAWAESLPRREEGLAHRLEEEALPLEQVHELALERPAALSPRDLYWLGRSLGLLGYHTRQRGLRNESALYLDTALAVAGEARDFGLLSFAYRHGSDLLRDFGYLQAAGLLCDRAGAGALVNGSRKELSRCLHQRAWLFRYLGFSDEALELFRALFAILSPEEDELQHALMHTLTLLALERGDLGEASRLVEATEVVSTPDDVYFSVRSLFFKARFLSQSGRFREAEATFESTIELASRYFQPTEIAAVGLVYVEHLMRHGQQGAAVRHIRSLLPLAESFSANPEGERALLKLNAHALATGAITVSALAATRAAIEEPWRLRGAKT